MKQNESDKKINEIYAFISEDEKGVEGVIGKRMIIDGDLTFMPFVFSDDELVKDVTQIAKEIGEMSGKDVKLIKLSNREDLITWRNSKNDHGTH